MKKPLHGALNRKKSSHVVVKIHNMRQLGYYPPILGYHSVGGNHPAHVPTLSADCFEQQLAFLKKHRFTVLHCDEAADYLRRGNSLPRKTTLITFDDGYEDNYTYAWPLLKQYGFPATIFVTPNEVGRPRFASWDQIRELHSAGITIGSHTLNHNYIPEVPEPELPNEIGYSKRVIEEVLRAPVHYLSYPVGGFTRKAQEIAQESGYRLAFTTNRTFGSKGIDPLAVRRVKITSKDIHPLALTVKLSGFYDSFRSLKQPN